MHLFPCNKGVFVVLLPFVPFYLTSLLLLPYIVSFMLSAGVVQFRPIPGWPLLPRQGGALLVTLASPLPIAQVNSLQSHAQLWLVQAGCLWLVLLCLRNFVCNKLAHMWLYAVDMQYFSTPFTKHLCTPAIWDPSSLYYVNVWYFYFLSLTQCNLPYCKALVPYASSVQQTVQPIIFSVESCLCICISVYAFVYLCIRKCACLRGCG